ncbi:MULTISPECIES: hypothetical protein [Nocardia]|uniref:hypothetical protein n=1 Tax=Nocardia TaxID=1817 RepID=UPI001300B505|nr:MULTISPECIES: hypothetical protein [Nocardia]
MKAVGVVSSDLTGDVGALLPVLDEVAARHDLTIVDVFTFDPGETGWIFRLLERSHGLGAHAIIVEDFAHVHGHERAVTGVADLHSVDDTRWYVGYGRGHTRPSADGAGSL